MLRIKEHPNCKKCPLYDRPGVPGKGPADSDIMGVGEAPGGEEAKKGEPFVGRAGKVLKDGVSRAGISLNTIYLTNAVKCHPKGNDLPAEAVDLCKPYIMEELEKVQPTVVIPIGKQALKVIEGTESISDRQSQPKKFKSFTSIPTKHPSFYMRRGCAELNQLTQAFQIAAVHTKRRKNRLIPGKKRYTLINNMTLLTDWVRFLKENEIEKLSFDVESRSTKFDSPDLGLGFGYGVGRSVYVPLRRSLFTERRSISTGKKAATLVNFWGENQDKVIGILSWILTSGEFKITTHNGMYDYTKMIFPGNFPEHDMDFADNWVFDTRLAAFLFDENRHNSLESLTWYPDLTGFKDATKGFGKDFSKIPLPLLAERNLADTDATYRLTEEYAPRIKENIDVSGNALAGADFNFMMHDFNMRVAPVLARMQANGIMVDVDYFESLIEKNQEIVDDIDEKIRSLGEVKILEKRIGKSFNINSDDQIAELLYNVCEIPIPMVPGKGGEMVKALTKKKRGQVNKEALAAIEEKHPVVKLILERSGPNHEINTIEGYLESMYSDGRIHTTYNLATVRTGRLSAGLDKEEESGEQAVNLQNVKRGKVIRRGFTVPPRHLFLHLDVAQNEIYWWAVQSKDKKLLYGFKHGFDVHCSNLTEVWKIVPHRKYGSPSYEEVVRLYRAGDPIVYEARTLIKNCVSFGVLFGMSSKTMETKYGIPAEQADRMTKFIFDTFPTGAQWRTNTMDQIKRDGYSVSAYGRVRRLPAVFSEDRAEQSYAIRQGFNHKMQSPASDMNCLYIVGIQEEIDRRGLQNEIKPILTVHDSIGLETHEDYLVDACDITTLVTGRKPHPTCPFPPNIDYDLYKAWTQDVRIHLIENGKSLCGEDRDIDLYHEDYNESLSNSFYCEECLERAA